jgi:uncharacterized protein
MPISRFLIDSSFLYAFFDEDNAKHADAVSVIEAYVAVLIIPDVVLTEVAYLFNRRGGVDAVTTFLDRLTLIQPQIEAVSLSDLQRARDIMAYYRDSRLDFVDCCIMALAEKLQITQVCTFDRRDFSIFRPRHCDYLELLP